jgi:ribosomal protein S27E
MGESFYHTERSKPCPECGQVEEHVCMDEMYAKNNKHMTVTCTDCYNQFNKLARISDTEKN